ncbi:MAG TPA: NAD(P)-binding domain-containing protein [Acidimicrobiales bacterium]|nr:NAD(P)-binding domain-containing protein [Acidimicrobiales bacterium]
MEGLTIGLLSPGEMGAAVGRTLTAHGRRVLTVLADRSPATAERAHSAGIEPVGSLEDLVEQAGLILSIVPPGSAVEVADRLAAALSGGGRSPTVVDANAVSPETAQGIADRITAAGGVFVDGDIIGGPPGPGRTPTRLYVSGAEAPKVADELRTPELRTVALVGPPMAASSLKMAYAAWSKGSMALALSALALARALDVEGPLVAEWAESQPDLPERCDRSARVAHRFWRYADEMDEIARSFAAAGLPDGAAVAAADVYRRLASLKGRDGVKLAEVMDLLE